MSDDLYDLQIWHGDARFLRPQICSNRLPFHFKAVLHEYLEMPQGDLKRGRALGFHVQTGGGGARNQNPRKYEDDAVALEKALLTETDPFLRSRYTFYLAQSYRDCGEREKSLTNYLKRAEQGFWSEEIFYSLYQAAKLKEALDFPEDEVIFSLPEGGTSTRPGARKRCMGGAVLSREGPQRGGLPVRQAGGGKDHA